jgi:hypothetical protein
MKMVCKCWSKNVLKKLVSRKSNVKQEKTLLNKLVRNNSKEIAQTETRKIWELSPIILP